MSAETRRLRRSLIVGLALALLAGSSGALALVSTALATDAQGVGTQADPIKREDLRPGLSELVQDESIVLANSSVFELAREARDSDDDLVFQIDYQMEFRSKVDFMSSAPGHVADLLLRRPDNSGSQEMNLYMSDAEVAEMTRRDELGDKMEDIVLKITGIPPGPRSGVSEGDRPDYGPNYGGIWQDQLDGGRIVVAVVNRDSISVEELERIAGGPDNLKIVEQAFSYNELENYRDMLEVDLQEMGLPPHVSAVWGPEGRRLEITVRDLDAVVGKVGKDIPAEAFSIGEGTPFREAGSPGSTHSLADQQGGLDIQVYDGSGSTGCTWGFNAHTNALHYIVTAGHCLLDYNNNGGSHVSDVDVWQNNSSSRDLTSNPYVYSKDGSTWDVARVSTGYANDNCYHGDGSGSSAHCRWAMRNRALHNQWELGSDRTCSSLGKTNDYKCGYIVDDNFGPNRIVVDMTVIEGDSGSGAKWGTRIDGILTDIGDTQGFYQTAYHVQYTLGNGYFYFNCAVGKTTRTNPGDWGTCPSVNP